MVSLLGWGGGQTPGATQGERPPAAEASKKEAHLQPECLGTQVVCDEGQGRTGHVGRPCACSLGAVRGTGMEGVAVCALPSP